MGSSLNSILVEKREYLINLCAYIHLNPLKANLVANLKDWEFSNYLEWIGKRKGTLFSDELITSHFNDRNYYEKAIIELGMNSKKQYISENI